MVSRLMPRRSLVFGGCLVTLLVAGRGDGQPLAPPFRAPIIPNASLVTARILKYSVWNSKLLKSQQPQAIYSLVLEVISSEAVDDLANLVMPGDRLEAFSREVLTPDLFGKIIRATVRSHGDEWGQRFWIRGSPVVEESKADSVEKHGGGR